MTAFANALETMHKQMSVFGNVMNLDLQRENENAGAGSELKAFLVPVDTLGLGARSFNSLDRAGIKYLGELVLMSENELKEIKNLGKKSLDEIQEVLAEHGFGPDFELDEETRAALSKKIAQLKE